MISAATIVRTLARGAVAGTALVTAVSCATVTASPRSPVTAAVITASRRSASRVIERWISAAAPLKAPVIRSSLSAISACSSIGGSGILKERMSGM